MSRQQVNTFINLDSNFYSQVFMIAALWNSWWLPMINCITSSMHKAAHMKHLCRWVTLLKKSVEITEIYSTLMNKLFILNKKWIKNFLIDELMELFHIFLFQKKSPAFVLCSEINRSAFTLCFPLQSNCNHYIVIKKYTNEVSGHSFIQNLRSMLARLALKWKGE